ncbi:FKBP-type peptidyl-prolyl cis-trans isomerase [Actinomycetaceae bacterium TAE3-ERU4]|nr:FKBP-type peptidyl-prolyl cis-trans isomerase [Actinomycetaceae bacterium TAE3-ERU4]
MKKVHLLVGVLVTASLALSSCGSASSSNTPEGKSAEKPAATASPTPTQDALPVVEGKYGEKPVIHPSLKEAPKELISKVLHEGNGAVVKPTDSVTVNYYGQLWDGKYFDGSFDRGAPATFPLNGVIKGWTEGLTGKKVGDRVLLVVPPEMGYGEKGSPPTIPGNSTLVFVVDIVKAESAEDIAKGQEEAQKRAIEFGEKLRKLGPKIVANGKKYLSEGEKLTPELPKGISIDNNLSGAPKITIDKNAKISEITFVELVKGKGPEVKSGQPLLCNVTGRTQDGEQMSTWTDNGEQLQFLRDIKELKSPYQSFPLGTRIARISPSSQGKTLVMVLDCMDFVPDELKGLLPPQK